MRSWTAKAPTTSDPALRGVALRGARRRREDDDAAFPAGKTDGNADLSEQLDLRRDNSWTQKIDEISTPEFAEVFAINALAPFVINSKLIPVLRMGHRMKGAGSWSTSRRWRASSTATSSRRTRTRADSVSYLHFWARVDGDCWSSHRNMAKAA